MLKVLKLGHVEFEVQDLSRMTDYYSEVIGLTVTDRFAEVAYLSTVNDHHTVVLREGGNRKAHLKKIAFQIAPAEAGEVVSLSACTRGGSGGSHRGSTIYSPSRPHRQS